MHALVAEYVWMDHEVRTVRSGEATKDKGSGVGRCN